MLKDFVSVLEGTSIQYQKLIVSLLQMKEDNLLILKRVIEEINNIEKRSNRNG